MVDEIEITNSNKGDDNNVSRITFDEMGSLLQNVKVMVEYRTWLQFVFQLV